MLLDLQEAFAKAENPLPFLFVFALHVYVFNPVKVHIHKFKGPKAGFCTSYFKVNDILLY